MSLAVALLSTGVIAALPPEPSFEITIPGMPLATAAARAAASRAPTAATCDARLLTRAADQATRAQSPGATPLGELPPARHVMTVLKTENGCNVAVVKENGVRRTVPLPSEGVTLLGARSRMR